MESASAATELAGSVDCIWTDAGDGTEDADLVFKVMTGGSAKAEVARIDSAGDITATSHGGITEANLVDKAATEVITGAWDFGGAADLEIPNSATPTVDTDGQIAIDTTITDHVGSIRYFSGEAMVVIAVPDANLTTTDDDVLFYDAAANEFAFKSGAFSGSNTETYTKGASQNLVTGSALIVPGPIRRILEEGQYWRILMFGLTEDAMTKIESDMAGAMDV